MTAATGNACADPKDYAGQRNRKRALPPKPENCPLEEAEPAEGRKSEPEAALVMPTGLEAVTPPPQRRKSMAGTQQWLRIRLYRHLASHKPVLSKMLWHCLHVVH